MYFGFICRMNSLMTDHCSDRLFQSQTAMFPASLVQLFFYRSFIYDYGSFLDTMRIVRIQFLTVVVTFVIVPLGSFNKVDH